jgi:hypothetical protein
MVGSLDRPPTNYPTNQLFSSALKADSWQPIADSYFHKSGTVPTGRQREMKMESGLKSGLQNDAIFYGESRLIHLSIDTVQ